MKKLLYSLYPWIGRCGRMRAIGIARSGNPTAASCPLMGFCCFRSSIGPEDSSDEILTRQVQLHQVLWIGLHIKCIACVSVIEGPWSRLAMQFCMCGPHTLTVPHSVNPYPAVALAALLVTCIFH